MEESGTLRIVAPILLHDILVPTIAQFLVAHTDVTIDAGFSDTSTNLVDEGVFSPYLPRPLGPCKPAAEVIQYT